MQPVKPMSARIRSARKRLIISADFIENIELKKIETENADGKFKTEPVMAAAGSLSWRQLAACHGGSWQAVTMNSE